MNTYIRTIIITIYIALCVFSISSVYAENDSASFTPICKLSPLIEDEGFIETSTGQTLFYISKTQADLNEGKPKKPLLLFIHGAPERAEVWEDYMAHFSKDYFTVAYNTRGYYPSSIPTSVEDYTVDALAEDAVAVAKSFGYDKFVVVGHDWGAATAWRVAINYADAVDRLVIFSNPHPIMYSRAYYESQAHRDLIDAYVPLARESIAPWTREATLENNLAHFKDYVYTDNVKSKMPWSLGLKLEKTWTYDNGASIDAIYNHYKALSWPLTTIDTCEPFPFISFAVDQPVLLFYGEQDRFVSSEVYSLPNNDCNPNTSYVSFPDGGHFINSEYKDKAILKMDKFLSQP